MSPRSGRSGCSRHITKRLFLSLCHSNAETCIIQMLRCYHIHLNKDRDTPPLGVNVRNEGVRLSGRCKGGIVTGPKTYGIIISDSIIRSLPKSMTHLQC